MLRIKLKPASKRPVRHLYSPTQLTNAYKACIEEKMPVFRASRLYGVPLTTLRDRVDQRIPIDATRSGPAPMFSQLEEAKLVNHIKGMSHVGYGYTRAEITNMATDYAVHMGKRDKKEKGLTMNWFYGFMRRWPELHVVKPSGLSEQRARCASSDTIINYYEELETVMTKYDLTNQPQLIYNIDEKGINTEFRPQHVVAGRGYHPQVVMSERSKNVTVIGAGNALGNHIPPFFVFPGQRMLPELMEGKSVGSNGTVTASGWSNSDVFRTYLQEHFMKYIQRNNREDHILVLYDGHKSHISLGLIDWAKANNVILFVLPPHCSHILQPMDVGCFGPFQVKYNQECQTFLRVKGRGVTRYDVCQLACRVYTAALSPTNLRSSFAKTGIYPLQAASDMINNLQNKIAPSELYGQEDPITIDNNENVEPEVGKHEDFFEKKESAVYKKIVKSKRRNVSNIVGGKAVTENETVEKVRRYMDESATPKGKGKGKAKAPIQPPSTRPGPSHLMLVSSDTEDEDHESQIDQSEKCCVCKHFYVQSDTEIAITSWAKCDHCSHWVHLKYCTKIRVRNSLEFSCPCCVN